MRRRMQEQQGLTVVELLVVMVLLGVVGSIVVSATTVSLRSAAATSARIDALQELEVAMQRVARDLRSAERFELVTGEYDTALGAVLLRDGGVQTITYRVEGDGDEAELVREDTSRTLVTRVDAETSPVFTYLDRFGRDVTEDGCTTDCRREYLDAAQVQIRLVRSVHGAQPVIVETSVAVRSLRHGAGS